MTDYQPDLNTSARDLGLLVLRIGVGAPALQAGLVKFLDLRTVIDYMQTGGWSSPTAAALMVSIAETVGGAFLLLGLLTPLAATAVVAAMIDAWLVNVSGRRSGRIRSMFRSFSRSPGPRCCWPARAPIRWIISCGVGQHGRVGIRHTPRCCHFRGCRDMGRAQRDKSPSPDRPERS